MEVGSFKPNPWGLYDMMGNVWERCHDVIAEYPKEPADIRVDPTGPEGGHKHTLRGGSYVCEPGLCRSAARGTGKRYS